MTLPNRKLMVSISALAAMLVTASLALVSQVRAAPSLQTDCRQDAGPAACVDVSLAPATLTADFYVNDVLAVAGVPAAHLVVTPGVAARIEARNIQDDSGNASGVYTYSASPLTVTMTPGGVRSWVFYTYKTYVKGFADITCDVSGAAEGEDVACRLTIDGAAQPALPAGGSARYALSAGSHVLHVDLVGAQAGLFAPQSAERTVFISLGLGQPWRPVFNRKVLLTIKLDQPGALGDLYLDGAQVATQAASATVPVAPGVSHKIAAKNLIDTTAGGVYKWADASTTLTPLPSQPATATLHLLKVYLMGFIDVTCTVNPGGGDASDPASLGVACLVQLDGVSAATIGPGGTAHLNAAPGPHEVAVALSGPKVNLWEAKSAGGTVTVVAGQTSAVSAVFNPLPVPLPTYTGTFTGIGPHLRTIFLHGQATGKNAHAFSKIGDCESAHPEFLQPIDYGRYILGPFAYLQDTVLFFHGSFSHVGQAASPGFPTQILLDPTWANPQVCQPGETPLACEYRLQQPAVALIMSREIAEDRVANGSYYYDLSAAVDYTIQQGIIPVLSTVPYWGPPNPPADELNAVIRRVAVERNVPLWDFWLTTEQLPRRGVDDTYHLTFTDLVPTDFETVNMGAGMTRRNLEALEVLDAIRRVVIQAP